MKNILYMMLALAIANVSCKNTKAAQEKKEVEGNKLPFNNSEHESKEETKLELEDTTSGKILVSISKSVCFGVCPAYTAQVFNDGTLFYEGIKHVRFMGKYKGKVDLNELNSILDEVSNIGYFLLEEIYDNEYVTDMPTIVTYINNKGKKKKIVCRFECDERIKKANAIIEKLINKTELKKIE